jgi:hypothetical protein
MRLMSRPPDWTLDAACTGLATRSRDIWTPDDTLPEVEQAFELHLARRVCARCPVRVECLTDALTDLPRVDPHSMRGGLTPDEQIQVARSLGLKWRREAQHGTRSRYVAGCRCDDCRAAHRVYEHERRLWARSKPLPAFPMLLKPLGRGSHRAYPGQLLLTAVGLPDTLWKEPAA